MLRDTMDRPLPLTNVVESLRRVDDRLDLKYVVYHHRDGVNTNRDERWAIILRWSETDPRRVMIQRGQMDPGADFDVMAYLPLDCSPEEAFHYFASSAKQFHRKDDVERLLSRIDKYNEKVTSDAKQSTVDLAEELISTNAPTLFEKEGKTIPKVFVTGKK